MAIEPEEEPRQFRAARPQQAGNAEDFSVAQMQVDGMQAALAGHLLHFQRLDAAPVQSTWISQGKTKAAAYSRKSTKNLESIVGNGRNAFLSVPDLVLLEGGEPIIVDGICIGGVGVSGVTSAQDAEIAAAGIAVLG